MKMHSSRQRVGEHGAGVSLGVGRKYDQGVGVGSLAQRKHETPKLEGKGDWGVQKDGIRCGKMTFITKGNIVRGKGERKRRGSLVEI